ncbi:hypothetical protein B9J07_36180 [Sinorhizobium sp. LM21]|nr:hypothetical protein B9J07_36180 [Sinorhizobium sp. LM21]
MIGIVAGFKSERWPDFDRNGGRLQIGIRMAGRAPRCGVYNAEQMAKVPQLQLRQMLAIIA